MDSATLKGYVDGHRRRAEADAAASRARADEARRRLPEVVDLLVHRFGARRVVLFGSLVDGGFDVHSDVDLAVEGLGDGDAEAWWEAQGRLGRDLRLDLVSLERAAPLVRKAVDRGEVLHGNP